MSLASGAVTDTPFTRTIRFNTFCQPSGVVRAQEMRCMFPRASGAWQLPHVAITSGSVTGMPSSSPAALVAGAPDWPEAIPANKLQTARLPAGNRAGLLRHNLMFLYHLSISSTALLSPNTHGNERMKSVEAYDSGNGTM